MPMAVMRKSIAPAAFYIGQAPTEEYKERTENSFQMVQSNPLSTFSADVDNASYDSHLLLM